MLFNKGGEAVKLSLDGKVTINLKKATGQIKRDPEYVEAYIQRMKNHLRGAQAEHATLAKYLGDEEIIPLHHVMANGPDRVVRAGETVKVLEVKSSSSVTWNDVKDWFVVAQVGETWWIFPLLWAVARVLQNPSPGLKHEAQEALVTYLRKVRDLGHFLNNLPLVLDLQTAFPDLFTPILPPPRP